LLDRDNPDVIMRRATLPATALAITLAAVACSSGSNPPPIPPSQQPSNAATHLATAKVSFCVGVTKQTPAGSNIIIKIFRGNKLLADPGLEVPEQGTVAITPGPVRVVVRGVMRLAGTAEAGVTLSGAMGRRCP
jgi:hypothetical protein